MGERLPTEVDAAPVSGEQEILRPKGRRTVDRPWGRAEDLPAGGRQTGRAAGPAPAGGGPAGVMAVGASRSARAACDPGPVRLWETAERHRVPCVRVHAVRRSDTPEGWRRDRDSVARVRLPAADARGARSGTPGRPHGRVSSAGRVSNARAVRTGGRTGVHRGGARGRWDIPVAGGPLRRPPRQSL
ncbi:hypothetical protein KPATCC21470_0045 [Kitasatospora purpeofusca]